MLYIDRDTERERERERERLGSPRLNRKRKREMAMQSGVGLSKLIFMVGAGYTSTILASRLPDILRELQDILQSDKPVDPFDPDYSGVAAQVTDVRTDLSQIGYDLETLQKLVCGLDGKINTLEDKQDFANAGVCYLCQFVDAKDGKLPELLQGVPKPTNKHGFLGYLETKSLKGLQQIADAIGTGTNDKFKNDAIMQNDSDGIDKNPICLSRTASIKCC